MTEGRNFMVLIRRLAAANGVMGAPLNDMIGNVLSRPTVLLLEPSDRLL